MIEVLKALNKWVPISGSPLVNVSRVPHALEAKAAKFFIILELCNIDFGTLRALPGYLIFDGETILKKCIKSVKTKKRSLLMRRPIKKGNTLLLALNLA